MKKILVIALAALMLAIMAVPAFAAAPEGQIAYYTFDGNDEGLTAHGENFEYADGTVTLGAESYYTADVEVTGLTEMTIAFKAKIADVNSGGKWVIEMTSEEAHAWPDEHYIGCFLDGWYHIERYGQEGMGNRPAAVAGDSAGATLEWHEYVAVFNADGSTTLYIDGAEAMTVPQSDGYDLAIANCVGENPVVQIGKANWGSGEYSIGLSIDTIAIYNKALSANEVATAFEEAEAPAEGGDAPQTGVATIALAVVAMLSGAYIVSKKH